jgi:hypothetical protein
MSSLAKLAPYLSRIVGLGVFALAAAVTQPNAFAQQSATATYAIGQPVQQSAQDQGVLSHLAFDALFTRNDDGTVTAKAPFQFKAVQIPQGHVFVARDGQLGDFDPVKLASFGFDLAVRQQPNGLLKVVGYFPQ